MKKTILIIEDDENVRKNIGELLSEEGYNILSAANGKFGMMVAKESLPDLIISDIMMPEKNGYELLKELSSLKETGHIPFLFLSAKAELNDLRKGMELGADDYLFKPFKSSELLKAVETRLKKMSRLKAVLTTKNSAGHSNSKKKFNFKDSLFLTVNNKPQFIKIKSIKFISADNQYSNLFLENGDQLLIRKSLANWEKILPENKFVRIHRSTIINLEYISKVEKWFKQSYRVYINDHDEPLIISKRFSSKIKNKF